MISNKIWELHIECLGSTIEIESILEELLVSSSISVQKADPNKETFIVTALFEKKPNFEQVQKYFKRCMLAKIGSLRLTELPSIDWVEANRKAFPAFRVGRFWVYGSHIKSPFPGGLSPICVDAAQAFGSGTHATTKGCMVAIQTAARSQRNTKRILDLGCGSGILSIAAKYVFPSSCIIAADYDKICVKTTAENWSLNQLPKRGFTAIHSDGFSHTKLRNKRKFDLIIANILAKPLRVLAPLIAQNLNSNGKVVLSGLLTSQVRDIRAIYRHHHLLLKQHFEIEEWSTLLLTSKATFLKG